MLHVYMPNVSISASLFKLVLWDKSGETIHQEGNAVGVIGSWTLICGRRRTGKTTLVKRNLRMDLS